MYQDVLDKLDHNKQDYMEVLNRIEVQTTKTNGRVSKLENWRSYNTGAIVTMILIGLPILVWTVNEVVKLISK